MQLVLSFGRGKVLLSRSESVIPGTRLTLARAFHHQNIAGAGAQLFRHRQVSHTLAALIKVQLFLCYSASSFHSVFSSPVSFLAGLRCAMQITGTVLKALDYALAESVRADSSDFGR